MMYTFAVAIIKPVLFFA